MADETVGFPRPWKFHSDDPSAPADGASFRGRFTGVIEAGETSYGSKPVARFIEEDSGEEISIWLFNQALLDQLSKLAPEKGELVVIDYHGKKKSKTSSHSYQSFKATAPERPVQALSWGSLAVTEEEDEED
jgi:hypothetical protein